MPLTVLHRRWEGGRWRRDAIFPLPFFMHAPEALTQSDRPCVRDPIKLLDSPQVASSEPLAAGYLVQHAADLAVPFPIARGHVVVRLTSSFRPLISFFCLSSVCRAVSNCCHLSRRSARSTVIRLRSSVCFRFSAAQKEMDLALGHNSNLLLHGQSL